MIQLSLDNLWTPANGQIFGLSGPLTNSGVGKAFAMARGNASGHNLVAIRREERSIDGPAHWASFVCFPVDKQVSFLRNANLREQSFGFLLIIELHLHAEWFLGIFKQGSASISPWLETVAKELPRRQLTTAFSGSSTVPKLSVKRIVASKYELYGASYEGSDLQENLPMLAASRSVIRTIRFRDPSDQTFGVTVSTSRVQRSGGRCSIDQLATLVTHVARQIRANKKSAFLSTFAQAVSLADLPPGCHPTSILFDWSKLLDEDSLQLYRQPAQGQSPSKSVQKGLLLRLLGEPLDLRPVGSDWTFGDDPAQVRGTLAVSAKRYAVKSILDNRIVVHHVDSGDTIHLTRWVRENETYSISFSEPNFSFMAGALYQRADFQQEVETVRRAIRIEPALSGTSSEKGKPINAATSFPTDSIFCAVESHIYTNRKWMCCTDLGDEWADYLCIENGNLIFVHCKSGKQTTSATSFHEIIGQAAKNLGRAQSTPTEFSRRLKATEHTKYWSGTSINRLRGQGAQWPPFQQALDGLLRTPNAGREVHIVQTMLSKKAFEEAASSPKAHFIQLIWLLASFLNSCREMAAKPVLICMP